MKHKNPVDGLIEALENIGKHDTGLGFQASRALKEYREAEPVVKTKALIICCDDWEGVYLGGKLVSEMHDHAAYDSLWFLKFAEKHNLNSSDIITHHLGVTDAEMVQKYGNMPDDIKKFIGKYGE
ncbi:hypothetical protein KAR91_63810 [Candidatus Pacearchaeota archaeon]|nr:hypothetical protein [Candidatus Pacearchaeota archaeon]